MGAGPYKVERSDFNRQTVTFVPNEKWWGEDPKLDKFTYRQLEPQAAINAFEAGRSTLPGRRRRTGGHRAGDGGQCGHRYSRVPAITDHLEPDVAGGRYGA